MNKIFTIKIILTIILTASFYGCTSNNKQYDITALYSDPLLERTLAIDINKMKLKKEIYSHGKNTYNIDILDRNATLNKIFVMTRGSNSIDIINTKTLQTIKTIKLKHYPRSSAYNHVLKLMLISGKNKAMSTIIDAKTNNIILEIGEDKLTHPKDYGGSNATGHPCWLSKNQFILINRENRTVYLYKLINNNGIYTTKLQDKITTNTSIHHFIREGIFNTDITGTKKDFNSNINTFYAPTEGSFKSHIAPSILKIKIINNKFKILNEVSLGFDKNIQKGLHHIIFHPNKKLIYAPSKEGALYIIDYINMKILSKIKTGKGSGHVVFAQKKDLAIVTNHTDKFITIINTKINTKIKDIIVSKEQIHNEMLQSHTQYIDDNEDYFYAFATDNGIFYELNLNTLKITRTLYTGGTPKQGGIIRLFY